MLSRGHHVLRDSLPLERQWSYDHTAPGFKPLIIIPLSVPDKATHQGVDNTASAIMTSVTQSPQDGSRLMHAQLVKDIPGPCDLRKQFCASPHGMC